MDRRSRSMRQQAKEVTATVPEKKSSNPAGDDKEDDQKAGRDVEGAQGVCGLAVFRGRAQDCICNSASNDRRLSFNIAMISSSPSSAVPLQHLGGTELEPSIPES